VLDYNCRIWRQVWMYRLHYNRTHGDKADQVSVTSRLWTATYLKKWTVISVPVPKKVRNTNLKTQWKLWNFLKSQGFGIVRGRDVAQAVSRRLPTPAARVRSQVRSYGICGGQSDTVAGFLKVLRFPLPILIPPNAQYSPSGAGTIGQIVADLPSGLNLTTPQEKIVTHW
jgi:hypothetical protein